MISYFPTFCPCRNMSIVPEMGDHGRAGEGGRFGPEDAAAEGHRLESGLADLLLLPRRPASLRPDEQDHGFVISGAAPPPFVQDLLQRAPAVFAEEEPPGRAAAAEKLPEGLRGVDFGEERGLALL